MLNVRFRARIQHLLPGHKYGLFYSLRAVFGWRRNRINNVGEFEDVPGGFLLSGRLKSEGLTLGNWFLEKKTTFFGCYLKPSCQFIELNRMETGKDIIEK